MPQHVYNSYEYNINTLYVIVERVGVMGDNKGHKIYQNIKVAKTVKILK